MASPHPNPPAAEEGAERLRGGSWFGLRKYLAVLRITAIGSVMYRGDVVVRCFLVGFILFVLCQLWVSTFGSVARGSVVGLTLSQLLWYLVITESIIVSATRVSQRIDEEVRSGDLTKVLVRPYSYLGYHFASYWGETAIALPIGLSLGALVVGLTVGGPPTSGLGVAGAALSIMLSLSLNFLVEASIGLLAFWVEDTLPFFWIYQKLVFTIGGMLIPLEFLPGPLANIAAWLPFASVAYIPGRIFVGSSPAMMAQQLGAQVFWILALTALATLIYSRAIRKLTIHGG